MYGVCAVFFARYLQVTSFQNIEMLASIICQDYIVKT